MPELQKDIQHASKKTSHVKKIPGGQQVHQRATFGNKCQDCHRTFSAPADLRRHQQYICADIRQITPTQNNTYGTTEEAAQKQQRSQECRRAEVEVAEVASVETETGHNEQIEETARLTGEKVEEQPQTTTI